MKQGVLIFILIILLPATVVWAEDPDNPILSPYDMDVIYRQEAAPYIEYVRKNWKIYKIGFEGLRKFERSTKAEFRSEKIKMSVQLELDNFKPGICTKIQFCKKPIYFKFSVTN